MKCLRCDSKVAADSDFCPHCGVLFERAGVVRCETDDPDRGEGVCILCHRVVCGKCGRAKQSRWFCAAHADVKVEQDWALIFESPDINEAEYVRAFLDSVGLHVVVRNFGPNNVVWDGGGDSVFSRQALNRPAKVFVPIPEYEQARAAFSEWESAQQQ